MDDTAPEETKRERMTLSMKKPQRQVNQMLARGQSKTVQVESKRRRVMQGDKAKPETPIAAKPAIDPNALKLSPAERKKREQAIAQARIREADAKQRAEEEARRTAEAEAKAEAEQQAALQTEQQAASPESAPDDGVADAVEPVIAPPEDQPAKGDSKPRNNKAPKSTPPRGDKEEQETRRPAPSRGERRRREGKLTIHDALNDEERVRSLASIRRRRERANRQSHTGEATAKVARTVIIPEVITIQEFASRMAERSATVLKVLMQQGVMANINDTIDSDTAQLIAEELGHVVKRISEADIEEGVGGAAKQSGEMVARPPVVTVMGHVDHGKTSLLDAFRKASVVEAEAGGITQHIGAYRVETEAGGVVTFIDTPGHAAFTAMRARGAKVTDIVVLVVAADDRIKPQTIEAIEHAKAANAPIVVAINKMDLEGADARRVKNELLQYEVISEDAGGDIQMLEVSAKTGAGMDVLLDAILLQAELLELKAPIDGLAEGIVIESKLDKGRGAVITVLIQTGTLHTGDVFVVGQESGRVRAMSDERGMVCDIATPSMPVEILGSGGVPQAGDTFNIVENEPRAREIAAYRARKTREENRFTGARASVDQLLKKLEDSEQYELSIIVKTDVHGSVEAVTQAVESLGDEQIRARVILGGVGGITESDVTLAKASDAMIVGFNVRANAQARIAAAQAGIEWNCYSIIYELIDAVRAVLEGMLPPDIKETTLGTAEVLDVFSISKAGRAAGCVVRGGALRRGARVRVIRDDIVIHEGELSSLRRFKDEVREANAGQECGIAFENFIDSKKGDMIECFEAEEIARKLTVN